MKLKIFGLQTLNNIGNWFDSIYTIILLCLCLGVCIYFFYLLNFSNKSICIGPVIHYGGNFTLIGLLIFTITYLSVHLINIDFVYSILFSVIFYSILLYSLTVSLIILRRYKIKKYCIKTVNKFNKIKNIQSKESKYYLSNLVNDLHDVYHAYTDMLEKDIDEIKRNKSNVCNLDIVKYEQLNIWENNNLNSKLKND